MMAIGFVCLAALGAVLRWRLADERWRQWPLGTFGVNVSAAFALGLMHHSSPDTLTLLGVGFLGSFSTFSTIIRETVDDQGDLGRGLVYLAATVVLGTGAAYAGLQM